MHINSLDCSVPVLSVSDLEEEGDNEADSAIKSIFIDYIKLCAVHGRYLYVAPDGRGKLGPTMAVV